MSESHLHLAVDNSSGEVLTQTELCENCASTELDNRDLRDEKRALKAKINRLKAQLTAKRKRDVAHGKIMDVLLYWQQECMPRATIAVDAKRWEIILDRFNDELVGRDSWSVEELKLAVDGAKISPWHNGTHPKAAKQYLDVSNVFRDAEQVEKFIHLATKYEDLVGVLPSEVHRKLIGLDMGYELEDCACGHPRLFHRPDASTGEQPCGKCDCSDMDAVLVESTRWIRDQLEVR